MWDVIIVEKKEKKSVIFGQIVCRRPKSDAVIKLDSYPIGKENLNLPLKFDFHLLTQGNVAERMLIYLWHSWDLRRDFPLVIL